MVKSFLNYSWCIILALVFHFLMFLTGYLQEDAFISFRVAFNLADYGVYSNNIDEVYSGATSLFYGHYLAFFRFLFKENTIQLIRVLNILYCIVASLLITETLIHNKIEFKKFQARIIFFVIAINPAILKISGSGMETSILLLFMSLLLYSIVKDLHLLSYISLFLLPFIRVDSTGFILIVIFLLSLFKYRLGIRYFFSFFLGMITYLILNKLLTNSYIPVTILAKSITLTKDPFSLSIFIDILYKIFFSESYFIGIYTKYFPKLLYIISSFVFFIAFFFTIKKFRIKLPSKLSIKNLEYFLHNLLKNNLVDLILIFSVILVPMAYATGRIVYPWYLWPFSVFSFALLIYFLVSYPKYLIYFSFILVTLSSVSILVQMNISNQDTGFRASIGEFVEKKSKSSDVILLEPAGIIPYFADCKVVDVVGLASKEIIGYHQIDKTKWWINYVTKEEPTFILDRGPVHIGTTVDGAMKLNKSELNWFNSKYDLIKVFTYKEYIRNSKSFLTPIYELGSSSDFYLYKLKKSYQ